MIEWIIQTLATLAASISTDNPAGLASVFALTVSAEIGIPLPFVLDTILFFTTYTMGAPSLPVFLTVLMLLAGRITGMSIIYWASRSLGSRFIGWLGRRSKSLQANLEQFQNKLGRWTIPVIVIARLTPGLTQISSVAAGTMCIRYYQVILAILFSSMIYDGTLIILGTLARLGFEDVRPEYSVWIVIGFVATMAAILLVVYLIRRAKLT